MKDLSVKERLALKGYTLGKKHKNNHNRMIIDPNGKEIDYMSPLEALKKLNC